MDEQAWRQLLRTLRTIGDFHPVAATSLADYETRSGFKLTIQDRDCVCDVTEVDDACPVLIGQVPLELMDYVVDPDRRQVTGNPAHGGGKHD